MKDYKEKMSNKSLEVKELRASWVNQPNSQIKTAYLELCNSYEASMNSLNENIKRMQLNISKENK